MDWTPKTATQHTARTKRTHRGCIRRFARFPPNSDQNLQRLSGLQFSAASRRIIRPQQPITLLEFFVRSRGLQAAWSTYAQSVAQRQQQRLGETERTAAGRQHWTRTLLPLVSSLGRLM